MNPNLSQRSIDEWYRTINRIYLDRNFFRDRFAIFAHLVEILGGLSLLASGKQKPGTAPREYVPKAISWWMALCGKVGVRSVEDMLWQKFPYVCTYCHLKPHENDPCLERKAEGQGPQWSTLSTMGQANAAKRPRSLAQWQAMFAEIYPTGSTEDYPATIGRFTEELGELSEALRVFQIAPGYFLSEAADVFAWLMHLQNLIHTKTGVKVSDRGKEIVSAFVEGYPDECIDCDHPVCTCPPILPGTLGRIAHEIPSIHASFAAGGALLSQEEAQELFDIGARTVQVGQRELQPTVQLIRDLHRILSEIRFFSVENHEVAQAHSSNLARAIARVEDLAAAHRVTQESIDGLARAIADLPSESRATLLGFLSGMGSSIWAAAIIEYVKLLTAG